MGKISGSSWVFSWTTTGFQMKMSLPYLNCTFFMLQFQSLFLLPKEPMCLTLYLVTSADPQDLRFCLRKECDHICVCSKATLGCFNQINGFIISFKLRVSRHFLSNWETCSFTFQSPFPNISTVTLPVALLKRKCSRLVWPPSFVMRSKPLRSRWEVDGYLPTSPFY